MGAINQDLYRKIVGRHLDYQNRPYTGDIDFDSVDFEELIGALTAFDKLDTSLTEDNRRVSRQRQSLEDQLQGLRKRQEDGFSFDFVGTRATLLELVQGLPGQNDGYNDSTMDAFGSIDEQTRIIERNLEARKEYESLAGQIEKKELELSRLPKVQGQREIDQRLHDQLGVVMQYMGLRYEDAGVFRIESDQLDELRRLGNEYKPTDLKRENKVITGMNAVLEKAYGAEDHLDYVEGEAAYNLAKYMIVCSKLEPKHDGFAGIQDTARAIIENHEFLNERGFAGLYGNGPQYDGDLIKRVKGSAIQLLSKSTQLLS